MSPEEYIKLLNTHAGGCFVSELYLRFRISPPPSADDDTVDDDCDDDDDDTDTAEGSSTDDDSSDDDKSGSTDAGDSSNDCDDGMLSTIDVNDSRDADADVGIIDGPKGGNDKSCNAATAVRTSASSRRVFNTPHPDVGISSPALPNKKKKKKPSKLESLIAEMNNVEHCNNNATKPPHKHQVLPRRRFYPSEARSRYFKATTFMNHSIKCGGHKQDIVAKDIHTGTNTLIFHARSYNIHHKKDVVRS